MGLETISFSLWIFHTQCQFQFGGKKYTPKGFSALKTQAPQQAKKDFGVYQKACFQGKRRKNAYTPKSLQGVCGGPLRAVLVYRFWPPINDLCMASPQGTDHVDSTAHWKIQI